VSLHSETSKQGEAKHRVFVAGATGVLGRRAVRRLVEAGHDVTGMARSDEKAKLLEGLGATPVRVDLFDADAVRAAVAGHEVVCNLATNIPPTAKATRGSAWADNDRIRREGSRHLVDAALAAGADRFVQESITFLYADAGERWIDEDHPIDAPAFTRSTLDAQVEAQRFAASGGAGVVLRFALFYGPDSHHTLDAVRLARRHLAATFGRRDAYMSSITTDDAAAAVVAALGAASGVYNVADDEPLTRRDHFDALARALGVRTPRFAPAVARKVGGSKTEMLARSQRVSNERFKKETGWAPDYPNAREGWPAVVAAIENEERANA
jgi:nucleoside-diphosphate-sugar epimerase